MQIVTDINLLRTISQPVMPGEDIKTLLDQMQQTLAASSTGVALAAIQIGTPKRVFMAKQWLKDEKRHAYYVYVNPEIRDMYDEIAFRNEGCLSFPGREVTTKRYQYVHLHHLRADGSDCDCVMQDFWAVVAQHEIDHMDGKVMFDRELPMAGRNEPCPCGSGKKWKKCCGRLL